MTISTVDGLLAGLKTPKFFNKAKGPYSLFSTGTHISMWANNGVPGAGAFDNTLNGVVLTGPVNGQLPFSDAAGGQNTYLTSFGMTYSGGGGGFMSLWDRLWHNGNIDVTLTSAQSITSPTWPARDANGQTNGVGVQIGLEIESITGNGSSVDATLTYTNSTGTSGRTSSISIKGNSANQVFYVFPLQGTDMGVKSVQSLQFAATLNSGTVHLVAARMLAEQNNPEGGAAFMDAISGGMIPIYNGSVLFPTVYAVGFSQSSIFGQYGYAQG